MTTLLQLGVCPFKKKHRKVGGTAFGILFLFFLADLANFELCGSFEIYRFILKTVSPIYTRFDATVNDFIRSGIISRITLHLRNYANYH